jgi:hypothetical protein
MAMIDVSEILLDPDFGNTVSLITRAASVNEYGEGVLAETAINVRVVVEQEGSEMMARLPEGARLSDYITVYYRGKLSAERAGGYADVVVWDGKRYQVKEVAENYLNFGAGFTKAICQIEDINA